MTKHTIAASVIVFIMLSISAYLFSRAGDELVVGYCADLAEELNFYQKFRMSGGRLDSENIRREHKSRERYHRYCSHLEEG